MRALSLLAACSLITGALVFAQDRASPESAVPSVEEVRRAWKRKLELEKRREPPEPSEEDFKRAEKEGRIKEFMQELERKFEEWQSPGLEHYAKKARARAAFVDLFQRSDWAAFDTKADDELLREGLWKTARRALDRGDGVTAKRAFEAYAAHPNASSAKSVRHRLLPKALLLTGEVQEAIRQLESIAAEADGAERRKAMIALGDARLIAGDRGGARKAWTEAGANTPPVGGLHAPFSDVLRHARVRVGHIGRDAPPLDAEEVIGGAAPTVAGLKGKVVVVQSFCTGCRACRGTMPFFVALQDRYPGGELVVLGLTVVEEDGFLPVQDTPEPDWVGEDVKGIAPKDYRAHLETFRKRIGIDYPWLVQELSVHMAWNCWDPHAIVVVGRDGKIAFAQVGGGEISSVHAIVARLLSAK